MLEMRIESNVSGISMGIFSAPIWCKFINQDFCLKCRVYRSFSGFVPFEFHGFRKIVEKIIEQKADYTIGLKQNQPALYQDTEDYFKEYAKGMPYKVTLDQGHGRIEKRSYRLLTDIAWLEQKDDWCGLQGLGMVTSTVTEKDETREYTRYFITSLTDIKEFADSVRKHWSIENQLHWCLDVIFGEDAARARKDHSPLNMNVLRKIALNLVSQMQSQFHRISKKKLMFKAALEPELFVKILFNLQK